MQQGRSGRLDAAVAKARRAVLDSIATLEVEPRSTEQSLPVQVLVACSGGADSLALAAAAAHFHRRATLRVGAVVVDHQMQEGSDQVASRAAAILRELGLDPVFVRTVTVEGIPQHGPEKAARLARYEALVRAANDVGAQAVLLGHTRDDQAETVLLGLARGSGTRSLSGMPARMTRRGVHFLRPLLELGRDHTEAICRAEGLEPWHDPTNQDPALTRSRIRHGVLPMLERELGPGITQALARTAQIVSQDADYLEQQAAEHYAHVLLAHPPGGVLALDHRGVAGMPTALRRRVLARACREAGGENPTFERLSALDRFALAHGAAGPLQMAGKVAVWRRRVIPHQTTGTLEFVPAGG